MSALKLYRGADLIGIVTDPEQDGPEIIAALEFTAAAVKHKVLLEYIMSDIDATQDPPAELNIFDDWFIEDENGVSRPIFMPTIYDGGSNLSWRWKG